jgi:hypothetical protein
MLLEIPFDSIPTNILGYIYNTNICLESKMIMTMPSYDSKLYLKLNQLGGDYESNLE